MPKPHIAILICNYNYSQYIEAAIQSALDQTYENTSIVVVDDCSTDNSPQIISEKLFGSRNDVQMRDAEQYTAMRCENKLAIKLKQNVGPSEARNVGIQMSINGVDAYVILDADDIMLPNKVERMQQYMWQSSEIGVVYADYDIYNVSTGTTVTEYKEPFDAGRLWQECIVHSGSMIRKQALLAVLDENGYYDRTFRCCEDYDLWMRISKKFMIFHVPEVLTRIGIQPKSASLVVDKSIWERNWTRVHKKHNA